MRPSVPSTQDFQFIGGSLCMDLVNTVGNRLGVPRDYFVAPRDVLRWIRGSGTWPAGMSLRITHADLQDLRHRRDYLHALFLPFARGESTAPPSGLAELNGDLAAFARQRTLRRQGKIYAWDFRGRGAERLAHAVVSDAAELLVSGACARIRQCQDATCGWLYIDRSRENNRRWCSMRDCGNRAKARRHYAQHHARSAP